MSEWDALDEVVDEVVGGIEEANATIGAALSSGTVPDRFAPILRDVQNDLLDLAAARAAPVPASRAPSAGAVRAATEELRTEPVPAGFAVLGGSTSGVGLLRVARMTLRRAARSARRAPQVPDQRRAELPGYLGAVAELLLVLAFESELIEGRELVAGWCDGPGPLGAAAIVPRRQGRSWQSRGQTAPRS